MTQYGQPPIPPGGPLPGQPPPPAGGPPPSPGAPVHPQWAPPAGQWGPAGVPGGPPGQWAPPPAGAATGPRPPSRWGKVLLLALLVGVVTLAGAGVGGFLITDRLAARTGPGDCGGGSSGCIPTLPYESVQAVLDERGFACRDEANPYGEALRTVDCQLIVGYVEFDVTLNVNSGHIRGYHAAVTFMRDGLSLGAASEALLTWLVGLPFGADPETGQVAHDWIARNLSEPRERARVNIQGYEYLLEQDEMGLWLYVDGRA